MPSPSTTPPQLPEEAVEALMKRRIVETHGAQYTSLHGFAKFQRERPADTKLLRELAEDDARVLAPALRKQGAEEAEKLRRELAQARRDLRYHEHHERKAVEELDDLGVDKCDGEDYMDSTDDSAGQEWSIYMRIRLLAKKLRREAQTERDQALAKGAEEERERLREAMQAKIREAERRIAGETPKDRSLRLRELLGSDWPVVTLMRDAGGKSSPPWVWWMENNGYDADRYEVEHYIPLTALDAPAPSNRAEERTGDD